MLTQASKQAEHFSLSAPRFTSVPNGLRDKLSYSHTNRGHAVEERWPTYLVRHQLGSLKYLLRIIIRLELN